MSHLTITAWQAVVVMLLSLACGLLFGAAIMWRPEDPGPRQPPTPPGGNHSPLPRAGRFPTEPISLLSEHQAQLASDERYIEAHIRAAEDLFGRLGYRP